ncbi:MAG: hypothetical protein M1541_06005, partial [Acidobacteria bacterium]|nr:hypothetical protein [Acidobacteriota bacterium]
MPGDVKAEHLLFASQGLLRGPVGDLRQRLLPGLLFAKTTSEQAGLPRLAVLPGALARLHGALYRREQLRTAAFQC